MPKGSAADILAAMNNPEVLTVLSNNARTVSGASGAFEVPPGLNGRLAVLVSVTASSGTTPTLDAAIEWSQNGTSFYPGEPADTFAQITAVSPKFKLFDVKASWFRFVYTIGGTTPSFSFGVSATGR